MKHARPDYNRIQDPAGLIPADEPVMLIRGQDIAGPATLRFWAIEADSLGAAPDICGAAQTQADEMDRWQAERGGGKVPDLAADDAPAPDLVPTPRDELSSIAGKIMGRNAATGLSRAAMPPDTSGNFVGVEAFNSLLEDAQKLAGFVMRSDRQAGPNHG